MPQNTKRTIKSIASSLARVEDCLECGDVDGARSACAKLHALMWRGLQDHEETLGVEARSVIPKDPD